MDSITFGHGADAGGEIRQPDTKFGDKDTIYVRIQASVQSSTPQTLDVVWASANDQVLKRDRATLTSGSHHVVFNYSDYQGMPVGQYKVGVYVDGKLVSDNSFNIALSGFEKFKRGMEKLGVKVQVQQN